MTVPDPFRLPFRPRRLVLFSGHRVDAPDRKRARFPADKELVAAERIAQSLDALHPGERDVGLTQGAAGGDLLFAEACLARRVPVQLLLPLPEPDFIAASILPCADGARWARRYHQLKAANAWPPQPMPPVSGNAFEACNRWLVATALQAGADELHLVCLWDGDSGDGPGGTADMVDEVTRRGGRVHWIDTRTL